MQNTCKHKNHTNIDNLENSHQLPTYDFYEEENFIPNSKIFAELRFHLIRTKTVKTLPS